MARCRRRGPEITVSAKAEDSGSEPSSSIWADLVTSWRWMRFSVIIQRVSVSSSASRQEMIRSLRLLFACPTFLVASSLAWSLPSKSNASELKRLDFAFIADAKPVSYSDSGLSGYCKELRDFLADPSRTMHWEVTSSAIEYSQRFTGLEGVEGSRVRKNGPGVECGPNSITRERLTQLQRLVASNPGQVTMAEFTRPFFVTSTKLMIRKDLVPALLDPAPAKEVLALKVGSLAAPSDVATSAWSTTNFDAIRAILPMAEPVELEKRDNAVKKVN